MNLHVARWGNSLALRLPAEYVRSEGIKEGDSIEAVHNINGGLTLRPNKRAWDRKAFAQSLASEHHNMEMGTSIIDELRRGGNY
jgi:antitoxin MazE